MTTVGAAVLAGGRGERLGGATKPLLLVEGRRIIERQLEVLRPLFGERLVIVANDPDPLRDVVGSIDLIADRVAAGAGPLAGLDAALAYFPAEVSAVVCVAGDMPFLQPALLEYLRDAAPAPAIVPRLARGPEPLCARYDRFLAPLVTASLASGQRALHRLIGSLSATFMNEELLRRLDPDLRSFTNINTPGDLPAD
ncbi:MAG TPA: molybdenum cofactor guanylyltransferase [Polyangia bacterium]|nr:molybdenum cofactor guanylyltransferase [Polyangia bacterium]